MSKTTNQPDGYINPGLYYSLAEAAKIQGVTVRRFKAFLQENDCKVCFVCRNKIVIPGWCLAEIYDAALVQYSELREGDQ